MQRTSTVSSRLAAGFFAVTSVTSACAAPTASTTSAPTAQASASPVAEPVEFQSELYGYQITLPAGWQFTKTRGTWNTERVPFSGEPGIDTFWNATYTERIFVAARPLTADEDLEAATDVLVAQIADAFPPCGEPLSREEIEVADEPARILTFHCTDGYDVFDVVVIHGGDVYYVVNVVPEGDPEEARARYDDVLATLALPDSDN